MRRLAGSALAATLVLAAGCSTDDGTAAPAPDRAASSAPVADVPTWNPCSHLRAGPVGKALGQPMAIDTGRTTAIRCALLPEVEGGPAINVSYQWFDGGLAAAFDQMRFSGGTVTQPKVAGTDATRLVVRENQEKGLGVSGFIQNGDLIQVLNVVALPPYDRRADTAAALEVLTQLSAHAPASPAAAARRAARENRTAGSSARPTRESR